MPVPHKSLWFRRLGLALLVLPLAVNGALAGILGDTVQIEYLYPNMTTPYGISTTGVVTDSGVRLNLFDNQEILVLPNAIEMVGIRSAGSSFESADFNGISVTDLTDPSAITFAFVGPASDVAGFNRSDISLIDGVLFINYEGLSTPFESLARVDIDATRGSPNASVLTESSSVPEPSTAPLVVIGLGLWMSALMLRREAAVR